MAPIRNVLLVQLPIPQLNYGRKTGNIPLGAACLKQAAARVAGVQVEILPEGLASALGDAALIDHILSRDADVVGFTVFSWNVSRSLYIAAEVRRRRPVRIVFGGPEATPDNPLVRTPVVDFRAYGEGEAVFLSLLEDPEIWSRGAGARDAEALFRAAPSPYLSGVLDPGIEEVMLIETQRGCPFRCGYCYYGRNRRRVSAVPAGTVLDGIRWALDRSLPEVFLLDPSFNARPGLRDLLDDIAGINRDRRIAFQSELRAEAVDRDLAARFARAGFTEFEIGLQTTTPEALRLMNRPMDPGRFLQGVKHLQEAGIRPNIDLIVGLPGDDPDGFRRSVDFVVDHGMAGAVQVFYLAVLPGTAFRGESGALGLVYDPRPPYTILETPAFTPTALSEALAYAEDAFDISLAPGPDLDLSCRPGPDDRTPPEDREVPGLRTAADAAGVFKVIFDAECPRAVPAGLCRRLTHPYQVFFMQGAGRPSFVFEALGLFTRANPHTPLEVVFFEPAAPPDASAVEAALGLHRPLYLDLDLPASGTRSVILTLVSRSREHFFRGPQRRQVFRWTAPRAPDMKQLNALGHLDGVLMDNALPPAAWRRWQDAFRSGIDDMVGVTFAEFGLQRRWRGLAAPGEYRPGT